MADRSPTSFGILLRQHRLAAMLTQEQLAARAHLSADTIRALERGKRRTPRPDSLHLLVAALDLTAVEREALLAAAIHPNGLAHDDPAAPDAPVARVAAQPGSLIGRESELATIRQRLVENDERARLLTLTGPAGVGKTRLAFAAADLLASAFADGVALADLAPIRDAALVLPTVARAIGLADTGGRPLAERLHEYLRERSLLLLLDNFEQVLSAAGALADLLANCPRLTLLVTSRVPLRLRWEWALRVAPLRVPDLNLTLPPLEELARIPAVALFLERARTRQADFAMSAAQAPLVAHLTADLDGLPLAIELAAARLDVLGLPTIARRLNDRLRLLRWEAPDTPERQHSLEAAVGWSYDLLSPLDQRLFRCLGVFVGQVSLPAIAAVVAAVVGGEADRMGAQPRADERHMDESHMLEGLASLAEKSLVLPMPPDDYATGHPDGSPQPEPAFRMLETVREFAWERLAAAGELEIAQRAHALYFQALAEQASPRLRGPTQRDWFFRLEHEHDNLRAALRWWLDAETPSGSRDALRLASALAYFWWTRGYLVEGWRWIEETLSRAPAGEPPLRIRALLGAGAMLVYQGAFAQATPLLDEAMTLAQALGQLAEMAHAFAYSGLCAVYAGEAERSLPLLNEAVRRGKQLGDDHLVGLALMFLGGAVFAQGDLTQAAMVFAESLEYFERAGDGRFAGNLHVHFGWFAGQRGDLAEAVQHIRIGLEAGVDFQERRLLSVAAQAALSLPAPGGVPEGADDLEERMRLLGAVDALTQATGMTLLQTLLRASLEDLRQHLTRADLDAAYRQGRSLPFATVAAMACARLQAIAEAGGWGQAGG